MADSFLQQALQTAADAVKKIYTDSKPALEQAVQRNQAEQGNGASSAQETLLPRWQAPSTWSTTGKDDDKEEGMEISEPVSSILKGALPQATEEVAEQDPQGKPQPSFQAQDLSRPFHVKEFEDFKASPEYADFVQQNLARYLQENPNDNELMTGSLPEARYDPEKDDVVYDNHSQGEVRPHGRSMLPGLGVLPTMLVDAENRLYDGDGEMRNPAYWNLFGLTSQNVTPAPVLEAYRYNFAKEDEGRAPDPLRPTDLAGRIKEFIDNPVPKDVIDDGSTRSSRDSVLMTQPQYLKYRQQFGMPGRPVEEIEAAGPDEIYNKQVEMERYGFIPYIPDDESLKRFHNDASMQSVNNAFKELTDARRNLTDFTIDVDGEKVSGKDFMKNIEGWGRTAMAQAADSSAQLVTDPSQVTEDSVPMTLMINFSDGTSEKAKGEPRPTRSEDGRPMLIFPDDTYWIFDDEDDYRRSVRPVPATEDDDYVIAWNNAVSPMELDSGQKIRADKAEQLIKKDENGQPVYNRYADYGVANMAKPYVENPFTDDGGFLKNILPWMTDMTLGSSPLFYSPAAAAQAFGQTASYLEGITPGYDDYLDRTYSKMSEDPTNMERFTRAGAAATTPLTEHLWGKIGNAMFKRGPAGWLLEKGAGKLGKEMGDVTPVLRWGADATNEALEEVPGNAVEELAAHGLTDWYADPQLDERGNTVYDPQGNEVRVPTSIGKRLTNYAKDAPLAMFGGGMLGGLLGASNIPSYRREQKAREAEREKYGSNLIFPEFDQSNEVELTDEERRYYDR